MIFLQKFTNVFRHKVEQQNKMVDAFSRRHIFFIVLKKEITSFDSLVDQYVDF